MPTIAFDEALLPDGWAANVRITFEGGGIVAVSPDAGEPSDARFACGIPGLANLHSHAFQRGMAGLSEVRGPAADSFWTWREVMYAFLARMTPDDVESVAAQAYTEMLEGGFTRVGEFHYLHHQPDGTAYADPAEMAGRIAAAAEATGIGLTLLPCFYAHGGFGARPPTPGQRRFVNDLDGFAAIHEAVSRFPGMSVGVAPHSLRAVTPGQLAHLATLGGPLHIHVAEQVAEVEDCLAWSGQRPVEWLLDHANLDERWCLIHATHMTPKEIVRLAATRTVVGLCPLTEANLGDGIFDGVEWQAAGGRFGVGSDSNVLIDAAAELRALESSQRLSRRARNVLAPAEGRSTGRSLFETALAGGAQALGAGAPGLRAGASADIVALDARHPSLIAPGDRRLDGWIFAASRPAISAVWVGGRPCVVDGRHIDHEAIVARYRATIRGLLA